MGTLKYIGLRLLLPRRFHRCYNSIIGVVILLSYLTLILLLINSIYYDEHNPFLSKPNFNDSEEALLSRIPPDLRRFLKPKTRKRTIYNGMGVDKINEYDSYTDYYQPPNITEIKLYITSYNDLQFILNEDSFGPLQNDSVVIMVQVHTRITYLRHLIVSLAQARDISKTLLIFSHDYYDEDINDLIQTIDFCKVMQIFYPHSIQTHPNEFPGVDPNDCARDLKKDQAIIRKCNNALYPDLYGHYREAKFTQTKHHWWWKANRVFDQLEVTRYHTGLVLFLEEDHYVAEDFLYLLDMMQKRTKDLCPQCNILSLGTYLKTFNKDSFNGSIELMPWISSEHNMGFAFNRSTWSGIRRCAQQFCSYDDYNWDWSLRHVSQQCLRKKLYAMIAKGPRVFHVGECGIHHKKKNCNSNRIISKVQQVLQIEHENGQMYPRSLKLAAAIFTEGTKLRESYGGWGDKRDHELCFNMTLQTR